MFCQSWIYASVTQIFLSLVTDKDQIDLIQVKAIYYAFGCQIFFHERILF